LDAIHHNEIILVAWIWRPKRIAIVLYPEIKDVLYETVQVPIHAEQICLGQVTLVAAPQPPSISRLQISDRHRWWIVPSLGRALRWEQRARQWQ
jgi:hypothetical protein